MIKFFQNDPFDFDPGAKWRYSNSGYVLLGYIVSKASGHSLGEVLKMHFFDPLGMIDTGAYRNDAPPESEAIGYAFKKNGKIKRAVQWKVSHIACYLAAISQIVLTSDSPMDIGEISEAMPPRVSRKENQSIWTTSEARVG